MSEVIKLPITPVVDPTKLILVCRDCGCISWQVNGQGELFCSSCDGPVVDLAAAWCLPPLPPVLPDRILTPTVMTNLNDSRASFERHLHDMSEKSKSRGLPCVILSIDTLGGYRTWGNVREYDEEQLEWLKGVLRMALQSLNKDIDVT